MLQPLRGKLLVEVLPGANRTASGLYLTPKEEVPHRGRIVSLGEPYRDRKGREFAWGLTIGHIVHYKRQWQGGQKGLQLLKRDMIFAVEFNNKAYAFADYVIVKKTQEVGEGIIFVPSNFESEVAKQVEYGIVLSVGKENTMGINIGDRLIFFKNEGLKVAIPLQEELWSLKSRAIIGKVV